MGYERRAVYSSLYSSVYNGMAYEGYQLSIELPRSRDLLPSLLLEVCLKSLMVSRVPPLLYNYYDQLRRDCRCLFSAVHLQHCYHFRQPQLIPKSA